MKPATEKTFETAPTSVPYGIEQSLMIRGSRTRYWEYGTLDGPLLVLIHGFRGDHHGLQYIAAHLQKYRVIIPDLPGFGRSEELPHTTHNIHGYTSWLHELLTHLAPPEQIHLIGHSFGSIICSHYLASTGSPLMGLTLINPISQPALESSKKAMSILAQGYYTAGKKLPKSLGTALLKNSLITRITSEFMMKNHDPQLRVIINGQHHAYFSAFSSRTALAEAYTASVTHTAAECIHNVRIPVQMIVAECDDLGTMKTQQAMWQAVTRGRFDVIPQVGHLIHYETPARAVHLITDFHQSLIEAKDITA